MNKYLVKSAIFKASFPNHKAMLEYGLPEFAFIGRSNVGKSSLINMLCGKKELAHTSSKPGKTKQIVCFEIDNNWMLVDLPGYGYAKTSKEERANLSGLVSGYLLNRPNLFCVFVLIDVRIPPQAIDLDFMEWCSNNQIPFVILFTKADKLKNQVVLDNIQKYNEKLSEEWVELPSQIVTSSVDGIGKEDVIRFIKESQATL